MAETYNIDKKIRIDYDSENNKYLQALNAVGADAGISLAVRSYTDTDSNTVYVNDTSGSDSTGAGTSALPYATIAKGINETTAAKTKVIVQDSEIYAEDISSCIYTYLEGIYADTGETPILSLRVPAFTPADSSTIFFSQSGSDTTGAGTEASPYATPDKAIDEVDATHQTICCLDSGTYEFTAFQTVANLARWMSAVGKAPTFQPVLDPAILSHGSSTRYTTQAAYFTIADMLHDDCFVICYRYTDTAEHDGYFAIYDSSGSQLVAATLFGASLDIYNLAMSRINSSRFVVAFRDNGDSYVGKFAIYDSAGSEVKAITQFDTGTISYPALRELPNDNWICAYERNASGQRYLKVVVYDSSGNSVTAATTIYTPTSGYPVGQPFIIPLSEDRIIIVYADSENTTQRYIIIDEDATVIDAGGVLLSGAAICDARELSATRWILQYEDSGRKFKIYDEDAAEVVSETTYTTDSYAGETPGMVVLDSTHFMFLWWLSGAGMRYQVRDSSGTELLESTTFTTERGNCNGTALTKNKWVSVVSNTSQMDGFIINDFLWSAVELDYDLIIDGIIFDGDDKFGLNKFIELDSNDLTASWSTIKNTTNDNDSDVPGWAICGAGDLDVQNCKIHDNGGGIHVDTNIAAVSENALYRNGFEYAIYIDGSGGTINIAHNTVYSNSGGIYLDNNGGSEVVKNNIIHENSLYGIYAETDITISYGILSDLYNVTIGASIVNASPLFIEEGLLVPDDTDLNLKRIVLGHGLDSPACLLADTGIDAGCYDVRAIGEITSWTAAWITKPSKIICWKKSAGAAKSIRKSGRVPTSREAMTLFYRLSWLAMDLADYELVEAIWAAGGEARLYLEPRTSPDSFVECDIDVTVNLTDEIAHVFLSDLGRQAVELVLCREYEI